jgi:mannose-6-phosphate isomerase-like protein (cupin superfamily)
MSQYFRHPQDGVEGEYGGRVYPEIVARDAAWILVGPDRKWADLNLGNVVSTRLQFVVINYSPNYEHDHVHEQPDEEQAYYVAHGGALITAGGAKVIMRARSGVFVPRGLLHGFENEQDGLLTLLDIHSYFWDDVVPGKLHIVDPVLPTGTTQPRHAHDDREEVYYVVSGRARVTVDDEIEMVEPGGVAFIPRGAPHGYEAVGDEELSLVVVSSRDMADGHDTV